MGRIRRLLRFTFITAAALGAGILVSGIIILGFYDPDVVEYGIPPYLLAGAELIWALGSLVMAVEAVLSSYVYFKGSRKPARIVFSEVLGTTLIAAFYGIFTAVLTTMALRNLFSA